MTLVSAKDAIMAAIDDWLKATPAGDVISAAKREENIAGKLLARYSKDQVPLAVQLLGRKGVDELAAMNSTDKLDWTINYVLKHHKKVGGVIWQHSEWFKSQLQQALQIFLAEARQRV